MMAVDDDGVVQCMGFGIFNELSGVTINGS